MNDTLSRRSLLRTVPLATVVALAGCTGGDSTETSPATTDAEQPGTQGTMDESGAATTEAEMAEVPYPEGWSQEGVTDPNAAISSHQSAMGSNSYTFSFSAVSADGVYNQSNEYEARVEPQSEEVYIHRQVVFQRNQPDERFTRDTYRYLTADSEYAKEVDSERGTEYERGDGSFDSERRQVGGDMFEFIQQIRYSAISTEEQGDETLIEFTGDELTDGSYGDAENWENAASTSTSGRLLVSSTGEIGEFDMNIGIVDETDLFLDFNSQLSGVGETMAPEPEWLDEVPSRLLD